MTDHLLSTFEIVKLYGNLKCKNYYEKYKKLGGHKDKLHNTLNEIFNDWEVVKVNNKHMYKLGTKRDIPIKQIDNRINNGKGQISYETTIKNIVLNYLLKDKMKNPTITTSKLAYELGLMSTTLFLASKKYTAIDQKKFYIKLEDKYKIGYSMFWHVVPKEFTRIRRHLESTLQRMNGNEITYMKVLNGSKNEKNQEIHEIIDPFAAATITKELKQLKEIHFVSPFEINTKPDFSKVEEYKKQEYNLLQKYGYEYVYSTNLITLLKQRTEIEKYDTQLLLKEFFFLYLMDTNKRANEIQNSFFNEKYKERKRNEKLLALLGGSSKPAHAIFDGTHYEYILENNMELLMFDRIIQAKFSGVYPNEYVEALRIIQDVDDN